jgi:hypothetical protein
VHSAPRIGIDRMIVAVEREMQPRLRPVRRSRKRRKNGNRLTESRNNGPRPVEMTHSLVVDVVADHEADGSEVIFQKYCRQTGDVIP